MPDNHIRALAVASLGLFAARFLERHTPAAVAAVFERSLYLEADGEFLCMGVAIGNGPINAVLDLSAQVALPFGLAPGQHVEIGTGLIRAGAWSLHFDTARIWHPPAWPKPAASDRLVDALSRVADIASNILPADGLAPLVLTSTVRRTIPPPLTPPPGGEGLGVVGQETSTHEQADLRTTVPSLLARIALPRLDALQHFLKDSTFIPPPLTPPREGEGDARVVEPPVDLLGLGPGLTPSGDDLLCGVLIALDALGEHEKRAALVRAVLDAAPRATTSLSTQFLAAASEGLGSEALHVFLAALISADIDALPAAIAALARIGHTSGWDALAGAVLTVRACAEAKAAPRSP